jgi:S-adenosylmethionine decarboxylase proenzyme
MPMPATAAPVETEGRHFLVEYSECDSAVLDDVDHVRALLAAAAEAAGATPVTSAFHTFRPRGVTGVVVLRESHISIHTWPETGYAAVDVYTCGACLPEAAHAYLLEHLGARSAQVLEVRRGSQLGVAGHRVDQAGEA